MIKSGMQATETAINLSQVEIRTNLKQGFSPEEIKIENPVVQKVNERLTVKTHFARLKKRMRCRPSSIF